MAAVSDLGAAKLELVQRQLVAATESAKKTAMHYVSVQGTHSNTASYDVVRS